MEIRETTKSELQDILDVHKAAFGDEGETIAELVEGLLKDETAYPSLSLAAYKNGKMIGHILFTKATITNHETDISAQILAPLAVLPTDQNTGTGQKLINAGLENLKQSGVDLVFVLGHPTYYPRCGFIPSGAQGLDAPYPIEDKNADAWMVQELKTDTLGRVHGKLKCAEAMDREEYWRE